MIDMDYTKLADATPEQIDTLLGLMSKLVDLERQKIDTLQELMKCVALVKLWPRLWADHSKDRVKAGWIDDGAGSLSRRSPKYRIRVVRDGFEVEARVFDEAEVPDCIARPERNGRR